LWDATLQYGGEARDGEERNDRTAAATLKEISALRRWFVALGLCAAGVALCVAYVDRPVADLVYEHLSRKHAYRVLTRLPDPLEWVVMLAVVFLLVAGCRAIAGRRLGSWMETPLLASWALVWASTATTALKYAFGRSWPAAYVYLHVYGFHPFQGQAGGNDSFPSGITAGAASILVTLWILVPRLRVVWALGLVIVAVGLVATNSHFVSDVLGGGFLGVTTGRMSVALWRRDA